MSRPLDAPLRLTLEATDSAPGLARLFAAEAARVAGLGERSTDDLRLAVSEVVTAALGGSDPVVLMARVTDRRVEVTAPPLPPDPEGLPTHARVLAGIPSVSVESTEAATVLAVDEAE